MTASVADRIDQQEVVELARRLIRFNTVNPPGNEEEANRYLGAYLAESGLEVQYQQVEPQRVNLIARLRGAENSGHLVFSGHMDVVPPGEVAWDHDPFAAELVGGRIVGRGAADMKGGVAAMAVALATLARSRFVPKADIVLAVSAGEERMGPGAQLMVATRVLEGSAYLIVGEPTGLDICIAQKGGRGYSITAYGRPAHSSTPHLGVSAISYMARVVLALEANPFPFTPHELLGEPTVTVAGIESGVARNVVPDRCTLVVGMRMVPGQTPEELDACLQRLLDDVVCQSGLAVRTEVELYQGREGIPPIETSRDHPLVGAISAAIEAVSGAAPAVKGFTGGTEAALLSPAFGLPFVICGPGKLAQAHQTNEYVEVNELGTAARAYGLLAGSLMESR
jgi:succinyl-diaminopimelate desuccinylase